MPINSNIALSIRPPQFDSPLNNLAQMLQLQGAQQTNALNTMKMDEYRAGVQEKNALRDLYAQPGFDPSTPDGLQRVMRVSPTTGFTLQKNLQDAKKTQGEIDFKSAETQAKLFDVAKNRHATYVKTMGVLANRPDLSRDMVLQAGQQLVGMGIMPKEMFEAGVSSLPTDPEQLRVQLRDDLKTQLTPEQMFTVFAPKVSTVDNGQQISRVDDNPNSPTFGQRIGAAPVQKVASPEAVMTDNRTRSEGAANRAQSAAQFKVTQGNAGRGVTYQTGVDGNLLALPTQPAPGQPITPRPVIGADSKPIAGQPSEAVKKELMSINQQRSVLQGALDAVKATPSAFSAGRGIAGKLPFGETTAGRFETPEETQARAYVFNNVSRVINERAGAAQSAQELARLNTFLPADTDGPTQIENKLVGFQQYLNDLEKGTTSRPSAAPNRQDAAKAEMARRGIN